MAEEVQAIETPTVARSLAESRISRVRHSIGGSHTVVVFPPLAVLNQGSPSEVLDDVRPVRGINLYAHIAFCEFLCPFCHYETMFRKLRTEVDHGLTAYVDGLIREWAQWRERLGDSSLASFYIGGGTPTSTPWPHLARLIEAVADFPREDDFGFCVEGSPASLEGREGRDMLARLRGVGVDRISMGVQTTTDQLLKRTRGHTRETLLSAMENLARAGMDYNIDLIQDLPSQDEASLIEDLEFVRRFRPPQVTWYIMRLEAQSSWRARFDAGLIELPDSLESARRRLLILETLRSLGYLSEPGGRFSLPTGSGDRYKKIRSGLADTLLGLGASAYSHGWGWFFRNVYTGEGANGIKDYVARIQRGESPIYRMRRLSPEDEAVSGVLTGVRSLLPPLEKLSLHGDYSNQVAGLVDNLVSNGLMDISPSGYRLSDLGRAFEEEICTMFYPPEIRRRTETRVPAIRDRRSERLP